MVPVLENEIVDLYRILYNGGLNPGQVIAMRERLFSIHHLVRASNDTWPVKTCSCGRQYTATEWVKCPLVGFQSHETIGGCLRNCVCGSTMFMACRREAFSEPKATILQSTIVNTITLKETRPPFTLQECMNISEAFHKSECGVYFDKWDDIQLLEAAIYSGPPEFTMSEDGILTPVYT